MENFSFMVSAVFSSDKSITFELCPEAVAFLRANGCLAEGKTKGSWGMAPDGKTMEIRPYAQADPVRKIVKDEEKVGAFTTLQRLKTKCRVTTALPTDLTNDLAKRLYEEDAASWPKPSAREHCDPPLLTFPQLLKSQTLNLLLKS